MKKFFKFIWYLFLILLLLAALAGLGYWVLFIKGWPWWIMAVIVAGVFGIFVGYAAVKKMLIRRNEKKFVQQVIHEESEKSEKSADSADDISPEDMEAQWKHSVERLKKSHLRRLGNPLYVLPWYIIIGESRSGKTSAIKHSNLSSTLTDVSQATIVSGTKHCDWWFLDQAIVLDTAGRYTIPIHEEADKKEWQLFLTLLSRYRKKEPINGVIVTVAADSLLTKDPHELGEKANAIRQRINQMMRIMGAKFPVYLLVTKMDLVNGFTDFCDHISDQRYSQVMGYFNESGETESNQVLSVCMETVYEQIRNIRSHIFHNRINHFAISFSNEFMALKPGMEAYVQSLFSDDIYQATPMLRGIYFSSACRKGAPQSEFLRTTGITYDHDKSLDRNKSYFLQNFFGAILPKDRNVFTPLTEFLMWRRATISLAVFSLMLILLGMSGVLTFSYVNNLNALNSINPGVFKIAAESYRTSDNILTLDRQRFELDKLESGNDNWILPRLGLHQSLNLEKKLKGKYLADVRKYLIEPMDDLFFDRVKVINSQTPHGEIVNAAVYAVKRIGLLRDSIQRSLFSEKKAFEKSIRILFPQLNPSIDPAVAERFATVYYFYLDWNRDESQKRQKLEKFQQMLSEIALRSDNFAWMVSDRVSTAADVLVEDFITGYTINQSILSSKSFISGAFTQAGRTEIERFLQMIQGAYTDSAAFAKIESDFWAWYTTEFYTQWFDFASVFPLARNWRSLVENWTELGTTMAGEQNPYFLLLSKMADEIEWMKKRTSKTPLWADAVLRIKEVQKLAETETKKKEGSIMAKLSLTKDKLTSKLEKAGKKATYDTVNLKKSADIDYNLQFAEVWNAYVDSLKTLSEATAYNEKCFHMFSDYFEALSDASKEGKPYNLAYENLVKLKAFLKQNETSPVVLNLITGPFEFMTLYGVHNSVIYLQNKWEEIVLSAASGVDPDNYYSIMFDKTDGIIWKFVNNDAAPFIEQTKLGFSSRKAFGHKLPFSSRFFKLLSKGEKLSIEHQSEYPVTIQTAPTEMNREAVVRPYSNTLILECAEEKTVLVNNNFLETAKFLWKPASCGDVTLEVEFADTVVKKTYGGKLGFARFLSDFSDGSKRFAVTDFPNATGYLTNKDVTDINISYKIRGIEPVLTFFNRRPPAIPEVIFTTLQQKGSTYPLPEKKLKGPAPSQPETEGPRFKDSYRVTMKTVPMGTNPEATVKPISGIFWLNCKDKAIRFENNNYPKSITFNWMPDACGKVVLIIHFPKLAVVKEYKDFFEFITDFNYKSRTFTVDEFPKQKDALLELGITAIHMTYAFEGDLPLLKSKHLAAAGKSTTVHVPAVGSGAESRVLTEGIHSAEWIHSQDKNWYTINILLSPEKDKVIDFIREHDLGEKSAVYNTTVGGIQQYNLIYGSFTSSKAAQTALDAMPEPVKQYAPWIRQFEFVAKGIK